MTILSWLKGSIALFGAGVGWFFGGVSNALTVLLALVIIDYLTGVGAAVMNKELRSEIGLKGIIKKVFIFVIVGVANLVDTSVFQNAIPLSESVTFFYITNEAISITENAGRIGLPLPRKLKEVLTQLENQEKKD